MRANKGAAGVDAVTLAEVEEYGVERLLGELQCALREGSYRPAPVRRVMIAKPDGGKRPLGMTVRDRVSQQAAQAGAGADLRGGLLGGLVRLSAPSLGTAGAGARPGRGSARPGVGRDADIRDFFGELDQEKLMGWSPSGSRIAGC